MLGVNGSQHVNYKEDLKRMSTDDFIKFLIRLIVFLLAANTILKIGLLFISK